MISALWNLWDFCGRAHVYIGEIHVHLNIYTGFVEYRALRVSVRLRCLVVRSFLLCPWWLLCVSFQWLRGTFSSSSACRFLSLSAQSLCPDWSCVCTRGTCTGGGGGGSFGAVSPLALGSTPLPLQCLIFSKPALSDKYNLYSFFFELSVSYILNMCLVNNT